MFEFSNRIRNNIKMTKLSPISDRFIRGIGSNEPHSDTRSDLMSLTRTPRENSSDPLAMRVRVLPESGPFQAPQWRVM